MEQQQHTPGPWTAIVSAPSKKDLAGTAMVSTGSGSLAIDCYGSGANWLESAANARLVAAAPELLSAAQAIDAELDPNGDSFSLTSRDYFDARKAVARLRAAIAAATHPA